MKKFTALALMLGMTVSGTGTILAQGAEATPEEAIFLYVATDGDDANDGSMDAPFATLSAAIAAARDIEDTVVINLRGGSYQATETIELTEEDSNLVIRSCPGETAEITGGTRIPFTAFSQVVDAAVLEQIDTPDGRMKTYGEYGKVLQASLADLGITDYGAAYDEEKEAGASLIWRDEVMELACYPNDGYLMVDSVLESEPAETEGDVVPTIFTVQGLEDRYSRWAQAEDVWLTGTTKSSYTMDTFPVEIEEEGRISSPDGKEVYVTADMGGKGVKFMNLLSELDAEGEWYLDRETGILYLIPPKGCNAGEDLVFSTYDQDFLHLNGAQNVTLQGIRFANTIGHAIDLQNCSQVVIDACEFTDMGDKVLSISGSMDCGIQNSHIHNTGSNAIGIYCGDRTTLTSSNCFVTNNLIESVCQKRRSKYAIDINGSVGVTVNHNEIHDVPVWAIVYNESNDTLIEYNDLYNICYDGGDCGVIYCGRNWTARGNVVRYNYIHDCVGTEMLGVYLDDMHSSTKVFGNVFHKLQYGARIGGGRDNVFENNLALECLFAILTDARGLDWDTGEGSTHWNMLMQVPYTEGIWAERYPELVHILEDEPGLPKGNVIRNNVRYASPGMIPDYIGTYNIDEKIAEYGTVENNIVIESTDSFADYATNDFTVLEGSEITDMLPDFEIIPFKEIGRQEYTIEDNYIAK